MAEYRPYPDDTETEPTEFIGTSWILQVPETDFKEEITTGDVVHIPPDSNEPIRDLLEPLDDRERDADVVVVEDTAQADDAVTADAQPAPDDADADGDAEAAIEEADEPENPYDIPDQDTLESWDYNQLRSLAADTPVSGRMGKPELLDAFRKLRAGGLDAVDDAYLTESG